MHENQKTYHRIRNGTIPFFPDSAQALGCDAQIGGYVFIGRAKQNMWLTTEYLQIALLCSFGEYLNLLILLVNK